MTNGKDDVQELEELLTELEGEGVLGARAGLAAQAYAEDDDAVTQMMDAPLGDTDWMVQVTPRDRRTMSTEQLMIELQSAALGEQTLVWRGGMDAWMPVARIEALAQGIARPRAVLPEPSLAPQPAASRAWREMGGDTLVSNGAEPFGAFGGESSPDHAPLPRPAYVPLPAPPPPSVRPPASTATQPFMPVFGAAFEDGKAQPTGVPASVPPPPPPVALAPRGVGLPQFAATSLPLSAPAPQAPRINTTRPVAVDFSAVAPANTSPFRSFLVPGIVALFTIAVTLGALSSGGVFESGSAEGGSAQPVVTAEPEAAAAPLLADPVVAKAPTVPAAPPPVAPSRAAWLEKPLAAVPSAKPASAEDEGSESDTSAAERSTAVGTLSARNARRGSERRRVRGSSASDGTDEAAVAGVAAPAAPPRGAKPLPRRVRASAETGVAKAAAVPGEGETDDSKTSGTTFNREAAKTALDSAASQAKNCRPPGGPTGAGRVQVRYEPSGKVGAVAILTPKFENSAAESCIVMLFRRANVPAFNGAPAVVLNENFEIP